MYLLYNTELSIIIANPFFFFIISRELSDINRDGCLDAAEFAVAMHLVQRYLQGFSLPPTLPLPLADCYHVSLKPHLPTATEKHVFKCKRVFEGFHQDLVRGILSGKTLALHEMAVLIKMIKNNEMKVLIILLAPPLAQTFF